MSSACKKACVIRRSFGKIQDIVPLPNLIEVQSNSFNEFVQLDCLPEERKRIGLEKVFRDLFPIEYGNKMSLEYVGYELGQWTCTCGKVSGLAQRYAWNCTSCNKKGNSRLNEHGECPSCNKKTASYVTCSTCLSRVKIKLPLSLAECRSSSQTFSLPLRVKMQLISWNEEVAERTVRDVKEQEVFFLDLPIMADVFEEDGVFKLGSVGTFVINGIDRVVVSQIHRSPGVVFALNKKSKDQQSASYTARIIPMRGSWIDLETDSKDILYVRIDKNKKILVTVLLQALGIKRDEITQLFYHFDTLFIRDGQFHQRLDPSCVGLRIEKGMLPKDLEVNYINKKITLDLIKRLSKVGIDSLILKKNTVVNRALGQDIVTPHGDKLALHGEVLSEKLCSQLLGMEDLEFRLVASSGYVLYPIIPLTLSHDKCMSQEEAVKELYNRIFPGDNAPYNEMYERIQNMFFSSRMYDLTRVGRVKINRKLGLDIPEDVLHLTREDIIATIRYLINLYERGEGELDDIDHLGNRRVRLVGELLTNQMYLGMVRIERIVREKYRMHDTNKSLAPYDLLNVKPLVGIVREFFATGQLSQFMDQTNPLSEIAHKRRLSSLGPGGVMKDRATYEVRDVHTSHYGRICPIETPEGQTIGLISSLATLASVNDLGFIETPYRPVVNKVIQDTVVHLDAFEENNTYIAQAEILKDHPHTIMTSAVLARHQGNFLNVPAEQIQYVDLSPKQLVSVATALIPFLEHDDAVRALMGSNMQRQAVPLVIAEPPLVGTGMESGIAKASGACIAARYNGVVEYVSAEKIVVRADESQFYTSDDWIANGVATYSLRKFEGSSHGTCIHQTPSVCKGQIVKKGDLLSNAAAIVDGELALGTNILVAFMLWRGYNYEDAIVLSKRLVSEDSFTSIHVEEYTLDARDTRLGPEEITSDIPNVSGAALSALDEDGIIKIGTRVKAGDILVGKVTLKGDVQYSPEEKLLRAIFGEKSREVRDTSLRLPAGAQGVVIDVKVLSRSGARKDQRYKEYVSVEAAKMQHELSMHQQVLTEAIHRKILVLLEEVGLNDAKNSKLSLEELVVVPVKNEAIKTKIAELKRSYETQLLVLDGLYQEKLANLRRGDPLPSGVIKMVKVYVATMRHIQVGDKIAGRHGNKGVVSLILPREDMPYMDDGTPIDVVLNPLGVPSRMNVGQILETVLGLCGKKLESNFVEAVNKQSQEFILKEVKHIFGDDFVKNFIEKNGMDGIKELAQSIAKHGVRYAVPVFDSGSFDKDIKPLLKHLGLSITGAYRLRDGRTGDYFDQSITVGTMYMMKLNHMVDDKLHARSVGPYSLVTQQPLGGKAQMGGQRFGEMEVWALEAYGSAYTLQELLTYKSDDVTGRHKVYDSLVRGETIPEPGMPESFNVLVKELQGLALRVDLFKAGKEDIGE